MLYHNVINSDEERIAKKIFIEQERTEEEKCWYSEVKAIGNKIGMEVGENAAKKMKKLEWK